MALTRESRMLILILAFGIGSVLALAWMADRYSKILTPGEKSGAGNTPSASASGLPKGAVGHSEVPPPSLTPEEREQRALRDARDSLDRFIGVRASVRRAGEQLAKSTPGGLQPAHRDILRAHLDRELRHGGLPSRDYRTLERIYRSWRDGDSLEQPFKTVFAERRAELAEADWSALKIMDETPTLDVQQTPEGDVQQAPQGKATSLPAGEQPD